MTTSEIQAFARVANITADCRGKLVVIRREDGKYLAGDNGWTENVDEAKIFDYDRARVGDQLQQVEREFSANWTAEPITTSTIQKEPC
jgi:hypothetical protein